MPQGRDLPAGTLGSTTVYLAEWVDPKERYQRHYIPLDVRAEGVEGTDRPVFSAQPGVRIWSIRSWSSGEGEDLWKPNLDSYRQADGIKPVNLGEGLELSRLVAATKDSGGSSDFADGQKLGYGLGKFWTVLDDTMYAWDLTNKRWGSGTTTGAGVTDATSITDADDTTHMYIGLTSSKIRQVVDGGGNATHYDTGTGNDFVYAPILRSFGGTLYALDGDDLYTVDTSTTDTRTLVADVPGASFGYLSTTPWCYNRMSLSDKGPIWLQRLNNGQTFIWEYNVASGTQARIGKLSVDFAFPYSIFYTQGYVWVGFRYANSHTEKGPAYLYFQRGANRGVRGPFRASGSTASEPIWIAGQIGDDLIVTFDDKFWAYNLTSGGLNEIGAFATAGPAEDAATFGQEVFASGMSDKVDRADRDTYVSAGELYTGRFDFDYPGLRKQLLEVTVVTDPLPANTSMTMEVSVDGSADTALTGTHSTATNRRFTWAGDGSNTLIGYEFELIPNLATTSSSATPTIRQINATVASDAFRIEWIITVDCSKMSETELDALNALIGGGIVTFSDPWQNRSSTSPDSFSVRVVELISGELKRGASPEESSATLRILSRDLVSGTGGS